MRFYKDFPEAISEIKRDLKELGVKIKTKTVQAKNIEDTTDYDTTELENYCYKVLQPDINQLVLPNKEWAEAEWQERLAGIRGYPVNPGDAYRLRREDNGDIITWADHLNKDGKFDYSYGEEFNNYSQVQKVIELLKKDKNSRQLIVTVFNVEDILSAGGKARVPCSINYQFLYRQGQLNVTYTMRSCEFATHFQNDIYFAMMLLHFICSVTGLVPGHFTHQIGSFHCYNRNLKEVF